MKLKIEDRDFQKLERFILSDKSQKEKIEMLKSYSFIIKSIIREYNGIKEIYEKGEKCTR
jgi:hypothetical protein